MKNGKAADQSGVKIELIKNSSHTVHVIIIKWINQVLLHGDVPHILKISTVKLIFKRGDNLEPSNYRPISIIPILLKIITKIVNMRIVSVIDRDNLLSETQFGFRPNRSTLDSIFLLSSALDITKANGDPVYIAFCDLTSAYDRLSRPIMLHELVKLGFGGVIATFIQSMYSGDSIASDVNGHLTLPLFLVYNVKQGVDSLSSTLFNLSLFCVLQALDSMELGIEIGGHILTALAFADVLCARIILSLPYCSCFSQYFLPSSISSTFQIPLHEHPSYPPCQYSKHLLPTKRKKLCLHKIVNPFPLRILLGAPQFDRDSRSRSPTSNLLCMMCLY